MTDTDKLCEAITTIAGSTGPGLRDTHRQLLEVSKKLDDLTKALGDSADKVAGETTKLTAALDRQATGSTRLAQRMVLTNILLVVATFALVVVAVMQLRNIVTQPQGRGYSPPATRSAQPTP